MTEQVPWLSETRYDIEARVDGNPTKDQYRLMMQALLADQFKLKVHYEIRQLPIFELRLIKSGKLGPKLRAAFSKRRGMCTRTSFPALWSRCGQRSTLR